MSKAKLIIGFLILLFLISCNSGKKDNFILIKGGTIVNTNNTDELSYVYNSYVLVKDDKIIKTGEYTDTVSLPNKYEEIDATGKYIVPGLIDGFATINNQAYANAFILSGVTSIIGLQSSFRRGTIYLDSDPSPEIFLLGEVGEEPQSNDEIIADFEQSAKDNVRVMLLMYNLDSNQFKLSMDLAAKYKMATMGELGHTSYKKACEMGINSVVHSIRYSLDIADDSLRKEVSMNPYSDYQESPKWEYYRYLSKVDTSNIKIHNLAKLYAKSNTYLMPSLSLLYLDLPDHKNPWDSKVSSLINMEDVNNPADKVTGNHLYNEQLQNAYTNLILNTLKIEEVYFNTGAKYLTGSATDVWGTMPGISLHTELELFQRIGLSPEQILASCTSNFSEAFNWNIGKIRPGYKADILVLNNNPIENIENLKDINILLLSGEQIDLEKLYDIN